MTEVTTVDNTVGKNNLIIIPSRYIQHDNFDVVSDTYSLAYLYIVLNCSRFGLFNYKKEQLINFLDIDKRARDSSFHSMVESIKSIVCENEISKEPLFNVDSGCDLNTKTKYATYMIDYSKFVDSTNDKYIYFDIDWLYSIKRAVEKNKGIKFTTVINFIIRILCDSTHLPKNEFNIKYYYCTYVDTLACMLGITSRTVYNIENILVECNVFDIHKGSRKAKIKNNKKTYTSEPRIYVEYGCKEQIDGLKGFYKKCNKKLYVQNQSYANSMGVV